MLLLNRIIYMKLLSKNPTEVLILVFLIITFVLSGAEKILDWKENVNSIRDHFKKSPLKNSVPLLLVIIIILEVVACTFMLVGIYQLYASSTKEMALIGTELCAIILLLLLIGQRLAKDYPGVMNLGVYFIITLWGIYLLNK